MSVPAPVRRLVAASGDAVRAAASRDADALTEAGARLGALDPELVRQVLGQVLAAALGDAHPGGLDGDDVAAVLTTTVEDSASWWPVDPEVALAVLLGAVGAHADEQGALDPRTVAEHAALVTALVLTGRAGPGAQQTGSPTPSTAPGGPAGPPAPTGALEPVDAERLQRALDHHLAAAVAELERAQRVEMP